MLFGLVLLAASLLADGQKSDSSEMRSPVKFIAALQRWLNALKVGKCLGKYHYGGMRGYNHGHNYTVIDLTSTRKPFSKCLQTCESYRKELSEPDCTSFTIETDVNENKILCILSPYSQPDMVENSNHAYHFSYKCEVVVDPTFTPTMPIEMTSNWQETKSTKENTDAQLTTKVTNSLIHSPTAVSQSGDPYACTVVWTTPENMLGYYMKEAIDQSRHNYPDESRISFQCATDTDVLVGTRVWICLEGEWKTGALRNKEPVQPKCRPLDEENDLCGNPPPLENGSPKEEDDGPISESYAIWSVLTYKCNYGYIRMGLPKVRCQPGGVWSKPEMRCIARRCSFLPSPSHGRTDTYRRTFGTTVTFTCNSGYELHGEKDTICQANGKWTDPVPMCQRVRCPRLYSPQFGSVRMTNANYFESYVQYTCNERHERKGPKERHCQANKEWSGGPVTCEEIDCGEPVIPNGYAEWDRTTMGAFTTFKCNSHSRIIGINNEFAECLPTKKWSWVPTCLADCLRPDTENGQLQVRMRGRYRYTAAPEWIEHNAEVSYNCNSRKYELNVIDRKTDRCNNGTWSVSQSCVPASCTSLPNIRCAKTIDDVTPPFEHETWVSYKRTHGYTLVTSTSAQCSFGAFQYIPRCADVYCSGNNLTSLDTNLNIVSRNQQYAHLERASFSCTARYTLSPDHPKSWTCYDGFWRYNRKTSPPAPKCIPNPCTKERLRKKHRNLSIPDNGHETILHGDSLQLECKNGYHAVNKGWITVWCDRGQWRQNGQSKLCQGDPCFIERIENANVITLNGWENAMIPGDKVKHKSAVTIECRAGYEAKPSSQECLAGEWKNIVQCKEKNGICTFPTHLGATVTPQKDQYNVHETITIKCDDHLYKQGPQRITCSHVGLWSDHVNCSKNITSCALTYTDFAVIKDRKIDGFNTASHNVSSVAECEDLCRNTRDFTCLSADLDRQLDGTFVCHLSDVGRRQRPEKYTKSKDIKHLDRLCIRTASTNRVSMSPSSILTTSTVAPAQSTGYLQVTTHSKTHTVSEIVMFLQKRKVDQCMGSFSFAGQYQTINQQNMTEMNVSDNPVAGCISKCTSMKRPCTFAVITVKNNKIYCLHTTSIPDEWNMVENNGVTFVFRKGGCGVDADQTNPSASTQDSRQNATGLTGNRSVEAATTGTLLPLLTPSTTMLPPPPTTTNQTTTAPLSTTTTLPSTTKTTTTVATTKLRQETTINTKCSQMKLDSNIQQRFRKALQTKLKIFPNGTRLQFRCKSLGFHEFRGDRSWLCDNGNWTTENRHNTHVLTRPSCRKVDTNDGLLFIKYQVHYAGEYRMNCYAESHTPRACSISADGRLLIQKGYRLELYCRSQTPSHTQWTHNGNIKSSVSSRNFRTVSMESLKYTDSGTYTCSTSRRNIIIRLYVIPQQIRLGYHCLEPYGVGIEHGVTYGLYNAGSRWDGGRYISVYPSGAEFVFFCYGDKKLIGSKTIICHDFRWSADVPSCQ